MRSLRRQGGVTLVMALIMLVLLTLVALTTFNLSKSNLQVVGNMQQRDQAVAAAQEVIEEAISTARFSNSPTDILANPCGEANQRCVDVNGDGTNDVKVTITPQPTCLMAPLIRQDALNIEDPEDLTCSNGGGQNFGTPGAVDANSSCANSNWEINAVAADMQTGASVNVTQGVAARIKRDDVVNNCPMPGGAAANQ
jgi:Tfp pilus assembly protein PilX